MSTIIPYNNFIFFKKIEKNTEGFDTSYEPKPFDANIYEVYASNEKSLEKGERVIIKDCIRAIIPIDNCNEEIWCCQIEHVMAKLK